MLCVSANEPFKGLDVILTSWGLITPAETAKPAYVYDSIMLLMVAWQRRAGLIRDNIIAIKHLWPWTRLFHFLAASALSLLGCTVLLKVYAILEISKVTLLRLEGTPFAFCAVKEEQHFRICLLKQNISGSVKLCTGFA